MTWKRGGGCLSTVEEVRGFRLGDRGDVPRGGHVIKVVGFPWDESVLVRTFRHQTGRHIPSVCGSPARSIIVDAVVA